VSRALVGRERTRARRAVEALRGRDVAEVARLLSMRVHTVAAVMTGRMLPGRRFAEAAARVLPTP
jgi:hypothetical protein